MLITLKTCNCGGFAVCPKFKNHFINKCALIYNIYLHTENMTFIYYILLHITVKKKHRTVGKKQLKQSCLCLTVSNAEYCDLFSLASPSPCLTL